MRDTRARDSDSGRVCICTQTILSLECLPMRACAHKARAASSPAVCRSCSGGRGSSHFGNFSREARTQCLRVHLRRGRAVAPGQTEHKVICGRMRIFTDIQYLLLVRWCTIDGVLLLLCVRVHRYRQFCGAGVLRYICVYSIRGVFVGGGYRG